MTASGVIDAAALTDPGGATSTPRPGSSSHEVILASVLDRLDVLRLSDELVSLLQARAPLRAEPHTADDGPPLLAAQARVELVLLVLRASPPGGNEHRHAEALARDELALGVGLAELIAGLRAACEIVWGGVVTTASAGERKALAAVVPRLFGVLATLESQVDAHLRHGGDKRASLERASRAFYNALLADDPDAAVLATLGVDHTGDWRPFDLMLGGTGAWQHAEVAQMLRARGALAVTHRERVLGLWPAEEQGLALVAPASATIAVGPRVGLDGVANAARGLQGLAEAARRAGRTGVVEHTELLCERLIDASPQVAKVLRSRVLGPLRGANGNVDLLPTLLAFMRCDRDRRRTAGELGIHRNTLDYRLARIAELTDLAFDRADDLAMLSLATRLAS